jgi:spore maturation protein CgeB
LKKIGDKKELDIKFDDFLTNLIFSDLSKKEIKKQIKQNKSEPLLKKKWQKGLILNKLISNKTSMY